MILDFIKNNISLVFLLIGVLSGSIFILSGFLIKIFIKKKIERYTSKVNGTVVKIASYINDTYAYYPTFKYEVNGVEYSNIYPIALSFSNIKLEENQVVELYYDPSNPAKYMFKELDIFRSKLSSRIAIISGIVCFTIFTFISTII